MLAKVIPLFPQDHGPRWCFDCRNAVLLNGPDTFCTVFNEVILSEKTAETCEAYETE